MKHFLNNNSQIKLIYGILLEEKIHSNHKVCKTFLKNKINQKKNFSFFLVFLMIMIISDEASSFPIVSIFFSSF